MYIDGSWHNVDINEIPSLAKKRTDVVFIDKRGAVEIVKYIGDIFGIAFVNTQGHFAEYPKDLIREINENDGCAGIHIAEKVIAEDIEQEPNEHLKDKTSQETLVFEARPPYEITDPISASQEHFPTNEAYYRNTIDKFQEQQYPEYSSRVVRLRH